ncbi:MAG TPA: UDP-N-acetylmuramoyl-tripeptide--D-alanyl-D-alanine ligase, partial [Chthoniobacterales bacterium]|nr:UDP-N-acetylmuramoyl-tripeptide--D-alanyl-D-alanine ligase [Chthoniobacterales bacterium]
QFIEAARERGAAAALVETVASGWRSFPQIQVTDSLQALQRLARAYRAELSLRVVGVTGSNGKTSTKEMVAAVLSEKYAVTKTEGNLNNHIGVPLSILRADRNHQVAIWEFGMNHVGELAPLIEMAKPGYGVITNIGVAHIEFLGSREAIAREKASLADHIPPNGILVLNADDEFSDRIAERCSTRTIKTGIEQGAIQARQIVHQVDGEEFVLADEGDEVPAFLPVPGEHMIKNAVQAVAIGRALGLSLTQCAAGLAKTSLPGGRFRIEKLGQVLVINDAYNANPDSVIAALRTVARLPVKGRRIAALGYMGELGEQSLSSHERVGSAAAENGFDFLIAVGELAKPIASASFKAGLGRTRTVATQTEAADALAEFLEPGDLLLVKGSRSAAMDRIIEQLEATPKQVKWRSQ